MPTRSMPRLCVAFALAAVARAQTSLVDDDDAYDPARKIPAGIDDPDYLYSDWYLGPRGINATGAWAAFGVTGAGVQIVFNDDGLDTEHAEFAAKFNAAGSCNDPTPVNVTTETHGTICAGLAVAAANSDCSVGVAPHRGLLLPEHRAARFGQGELVGSEAAQAERTGRGRRRAT